MDIKDLIVTPFFLILIYILAYRYKRNHIEDPVQKKFFIPGLTVKIVGAITLGLIYQFYYGGGDTLNFVELGTKHVYHAFLNEPMKGLKLLLSDGTNKAELYPYSGRIYHFSDQASFLIIKLASIVGLFSFHTYSVMAIMFGIFSFSGSWAMYTSVCKLYPNQSFKKYAAYAMFFIPSVFFWGSGLLKDSITFGAICWLFYAFCNLFIFKKKIVNSIIILVISFYLIKVIKIYILLCLLPAIIIWLFFHFNYRLKSRWLKVALKPVLISLAVILAYFAADFVSLDNKRYSLDKLTTTAKVTYDYLTYMSKSQGGAYYSLGPLENNYASLISKAPLAINVSLFRPYLWESRNPVMIISALEALVFLILTLYIIFKTGLIKSFKLINQDPFLIFCLTFSLSFAFAIGISTANFGTLVRYKIPLLPFYLIFLIALRNKVLQLKAQDARNLETIKYANQKTR